MWRLPVVRLPAGISSSRSSSRKRPGPLRSAARQQIRRNITNNISASQVFSNQRTATAHTATATKWITAVPAIPTIHRFSNRSRAICEASLGATLCRAAADPMAISETSYGSILTEIHLLRAEIFKRFLG
jgi:hypothetical protein